MNGFEDTPSIVNNQITDKAGKKVSYSQLTGEEKRDYLFDQGIRPTAYKVGMPDLLGGVIRFSESALKTEREHSLSKSLTRVSDEFERPQQKLFHTFAPPKSFSIANPVRLIRASSAASGRLVWQGFLMLVRSLALALCLG